MQDPTRREVRTDRAPAPAWSYSQGIVFQNCLYVAGQVPRDPVSGEIPELFADQARQALDNLSAVAEAAGTSLRHALRVGVYLSDRTRIAELDPIYASYFERPFPARTTIEAGLRGIQIEVDAVVALPQS